MGFALRWHYASATRNPWIKSHHCVFRSLLCIFLASCSLSSRDVPCEQIEWPFLGSPRTLSGAGQLLCQFGPDPLCSESQYCAHLSVGHGGAGLRPPMNPQNCGPVYLHLGLAVGSTQYPTPKLCAGFGREKQGAIEVRCPA